MLFGFIYFIYASCQVEHEKILTLLMGCMLYIFNY